VSGEAAVTENDTDWPVVLLAEVGCEEIVGALALRIVKFTDASVIA
jgi:hypothetical protein